MDFRSEALRRSILKALAALPLAAVSPVLARNAVSVNSALILCFNYLHVAYNTLANPHNDGVLIESRLKQLSFGVVDRLDEADEATLEDRIQKFVAGLRPDGLALVYIAGHGVQLDGENYLLLADGKTFISLASLVDVVRRQSGTTVFMLDACRNNPFRDDAEDDHPVRAITIRGGGDANRSIDPAAFGFSFRSLTLTPGGAKTIAPFQLKGSGVRIVFATDPQNVAADAASPADHDSPFAIAIARRLGERRSLDDVITLATGDVVAATGGQQSPWSQGSIGLPIFLAGQPKTGNPATPPFQVPG